MKYLCIIAGVLSCLSIQGMNLSDSLHIHINEAWEVAWERFYHPKTNLFYDYISSYEKGKELAHLPTLEEVSKQYPNPCGYGTGMEDCMIIGGVMLSTIVDMYEITKDDSLINPAINVFNGIKRCTTIPDNLGFVARGICIEDRKSFYINSSRDQYTHCVHGLWKLYHSPLSSTTIKKDICDILTNIAERMIKNVTPENEYDFLRADGKICPLGICRMWNVQPHEAARLPMIYAAAFDVTGNNKYKKLYRLYISEAIDQSEQINNNYAAYVFLQMQCSFELLYSLEEKPTLKEQLDKLMKRVATMSEERFHDCKKKLSDMDIHTLSMLGPDWRKVDEWTNQKGYIIPQWGEYRTVWECVREAGETLSALFMTNSQLENSQTHCLEDLIINMNYNQLSGCGIIYHIAAYWKARYKDYLDNK
ncbi:MAG: hypothetical protein LBL58_06775 [Tannerellaceae bacterium]|jgi:hypothetical protein|nr:hypothetical protein [Tannerellaceae bacterium]